MGVLSPTPSCSAKRLVGQGLNPTEFAKRPPAHYGGAAALQPNDMSWIPERKPEDLAQMWVAAPACDSAFNRPCDQVLCPTSMTAAAAVKAAA